MNTKHKLALAAVLALTLAVLVLVLAANVGGKSRLQGDGWKDSPPSFTDGMDFGHERSMKQLAGPIAEPFTDIQGHWAESYIEQIRLAGLTVGCSDDPSMFCPDRPLTRAEAAVFMARLLELAR